MLQVFNLGLHPERNTEVQKLRNFKTHYTVSSNRNAIHVKVF